MRYVKQTNKLIREIRGRTGLTQNKHENIKVFMGRLLAAEGIAAPSQVNRGQFVTILAKKGLVKDLKPQKINKTSKKSRSSPRREISQNSPTERMIKEFYASWEWKRLSYDVKLDRGRKCECCGAKAPSVAIHTDHIKPLRRYWHLRLDRQNMQVLCEDCNMGKGSRDETDFREELLTSEQQSRLNAIREQLKIN